MAEITSIHFDMDGVLIDSEHLHVAAEQQTCRNYDFAIDPSDWPGFKGQKAEAIFEHLIEQYGDPDVHTAAELIDHKTDLFIGFAEAELQLIDGARDFLDWARSAFETVNLVTSSNRRVQEFIFRHFSLDHLFDHVVNGDDVANGKPDPEPYLRSLELASASPETALVVEDSQSGIASAKAAGCLVLAVTTSHSAEELLAAEPNYIANDYLHARWHIDPNWGKWRLWRTDIYGNQYASERLYPDESQAAEQQQVFTDRGHHQTYDIRPYIPGELDHRLNT